MKIHSFKVFILFFFFVIFLSIKSIGQSNTDSLLNVVKYGKNDTSKVKALEYLCGDVIISNPDEAIIYAKEAMALSQKICFSNGIARSYENIGYAYYRKGDFNKALINTFAAIKFYETTGEKNKIQRCYNAIGCFYNEQGNYSGAIKFGLIALYNYEMLGDKSGMAMTYANIGNAYVNSNNLNLALKYYKKSLEYSIKYDYKEIIPINLIGIGNIYRRKKNDTLALKYYHEALKQNQGELNHMTAGCYNNLGNIYSGQKKYLKAIEFYKKSLEINQKFNYKWSASINLLNIADLYKATGDYNKAIDFSLKSLSLGEEMNTLSIIMDNAEILANIYAKMGDYKKGYEYHKYYKQIYDSIYNITTNKQIKEIEAQYQNEKKEKEIISKTNQIEILEQREIVSSYKRWALTTGTFIIIVISLILINNQRRKIKLNRQVFETQKQLTDLALNNEKLKSSHLQNELDFRTKELEFKDKEIKFKNKELEYKNKEIANFALHIIEKNEFINTLRSAIAESGELLKPKELIKAIDENIRSLENDRQEFEARIEQISKSFFLSLKERATGISKNEERTAALLRLNLSSKDIAIILNISLRSVEIYRYNLRKKLSLAKEDHLPEYLSLL